MKGKSLPTFLSQVQQITQAPITRLPAPLPLSPHRQIVFWTTSTAELMAVENGRERSLSWAAVASAFERARRHKDAASSARTDHACWL